MWLWIAMAMAVAGGDGVRSLAEAEVLLHAPPIVRAPVDAVANAVSGSRRNGVVFELLNPGSLVETYSLRCEVSGVASRCRLDSPDAEVESGASVFVRVRYTATAAGAGEVKLIATHVAVTASASYAIRATPPVVGASGESLAGPTAAGESGGDGGGAAPWIEINPAGGTFGSSSVPVSIQWCGNGGTLDPTTRSIELDRTDVTGSFTYVVDLECGYRSDGTIAISPGGSRLTATICNYSGPCTSASATFYAGGGKAPVVSLAPNPGGRIERADCVISSAGPGAAFQCGELIATHSMPAYRSMNRERELTLFYSSGTARIQPVVMADISLPSASTVPVSFRI
ncbi:MAG: hypothetical protein ACREK1_10290 [Longimicrobiales bacterium]